MAYAQPAADHGESQPACSSGAPSWADSGQVKRSDPLKVRRRVCYQAKRRSEALSRQRDARRDLSTHIRRVAVEALVQDVEAEVSAVISPMTTSKGVEHACLSAANCTERACPLLVVALPRTWRRLPSQPGPMEKCTLDKRGTGPAAMQATQRAHAASMHGSSCSRSG